MSKYQKKYSHNSRAGRKRIYPQEIIDFMMANTRDMSDSELCETINARFNLSTSRQSIKSLRRYYGIVKGREKYKPYQAFTERTKRNGYVTIKTAEGKWENKHKFLYEQANGKVPEGYMVIFLDGRKDNFSLDNLTLVTNAEHTKLRALGLRFNDPNLTQTGIAIVRHSNILKARTRRK